MNPETAEKKHRLSETEWRELCAEWERGELPQKQFCKDRGIDYARFTWWRSKILTEQGKSRRNKSSSIKPVELGCMPSRPAESLQLYLPTGVRVLVPSTCSKEQLSMALDALGVTQC
tara:strand:- start:364 stop:714 length:351 start_codon:yes stop_codon:yes gene_type:complete